MVYRPVVRDSVSTPTNSEPVIAACLLDSGADYCLLPARVAASLGLQLTSLPCSFVSGIGNQPVEIYSSTVTFRIGPEISFQAQVGFSTALEGLGVFGQQGFFDQFHVEFRLAEGFFTIEAANKPAVH